MFVTGAVLLLLLGSFSCGQNETEEISVGVVVPLTGPLSSNGLQMKNGMELALGEINESPLLDGKEIRFIVEDSEGTPDGAERAYRKLIEQDGVVAVLGPFTSSATERIIPVVQQNKVVAFSPTSAARGLSARSEFAFRASLTVDPLVQAGVMVTRERLKYDNVATIVNESDAFSSSNHEKVKEELEKYGVRIVSEQTYSRPTGALPDLTDQLIRIKDTDPDAIFVSALPPEQPGVMVQARRLGIADVPFIITHLSIGVARVANNTEPGSAEGSITSTSWIAAVDIPENRKFLRNYREKYDGEPGSFSALSYVSVYILAEAVSNAVSTDPRAIRNAIADLRLNTLLGEFYFDRNGDAVYEPIVARVKDGKFEVIGQ